MAWIHFMVFFRNCIFQKWLGTDRRSFSNRATCRNRGCCRTRTEITHHLDFGLAKHCLLHISDSFRPLISLFQVKFWKFVTWHLLKLVEMHTAGSSFCNNLFSKLLFFRNYTLAAGFMFITAQSAASSGMRIVFTNCNFSSKFSSKIDLKLSVFSHFQAKNCCFFAFFCEIRTQSLPVRGRRRRAPQARSERLSLLQISVN